MIADCRALTTRSAAKSGAARGAQHQQGGVPPFDRNRDEQGGLVGRRQVGRNEGAVVARLAGGQHQNAAAHRPGERRGGGPLPVLGRIGIARDATQDIAVVEQDQALVVREHAARGCEQACKRRRVARDVEQGIEQGETGDGPRARAVALPAGGILCALGAHHARSRERDVRWRIAASIAGVGPRPALARTPMPGEFQADDRPRDLSGENLQADVLEISFDRPPRRRKFG